MGAATETTNDPELRAARSRIRRLERELEASETRLAELEASRSWRLTAPLRDSRWRLRDAGERLKLRGESLADDAAYVRSEVGWRLRRSRDNLASVGRFDEATPAWLEALTESLTRIPLRTTKRLLYNRRYWATGDPLKRPLYHPLADALYDELRPAGVVDVGCGTGIMLARLEERGVEIRGVEGSRAAIAASPVGDRIEHWDLIRGVPEHGRYDHCRCIEGAAHLAHLNQQPHEYWIEQFAELGFAQSPLRDRLRATVAAVPDAPWVQKNLHVFERARERRA